MAAWDFITSTFCLSPLCHLDCRTTKTAARWGLPHVGFDQGGRMLPVRPARRIFDCAPRLRDGAGCGWVSVDVALAVDSSGW